LLNFNFFQIFFYFPKKLYIVYVNIQCYNASFLGQLVVHDMYCLAGKNRINRALCAAGLSYCLLMLSFVVKLKNFAFSKVKDSGIDVMLKLMAKH